MGIDDEIARGEIGNVWERRYRGTMDLLVEVQRELATASAEVLKLRNERHLDNEDLARAFDMGWDKATAAVVAWLDAHLNLEWCDCCGQRGTTISEIANAIERGEHRREEER